MLGGFRYGCCMASHQAKQQVSPFKHLLNFLQIPSQPTYTNYGVAVDFAGAPDDNPLYRGRQPDVNDNDSSGVGTSEVVNVGLLGLGGVSDVGVAIDQVQGLLSSRKRALVDNQISMRGQ